MSYPYQQPPYGGGPPPPQQGYSHGYQQYPQPGHHQYGAPQQGGAYGAPGAYGQPSAAYPGGPPPPQMHGYGPPQGQHGYGPQTTHQQPYGAPSMNNNMGPISYYLGVPIPPPVGVGQPAPPPPGFDVYGGVESLRKAMKGFGTDERALINTLAPYDAFQMDAVSRQFKTTTGKDLMQNIESETRSYFEASLRGKVLGPVGFDVYLIHRASVGAGTHEDILNEILLMRTNDEIWLLKQAYRATYNKDLVKVVEGELSMKTKRLFIMALEGARMEETAPINHQLVEQDSRELRAAARGAGTDEIKICGIMASRSTAHLQAVAQAYQHHHGKTLQSMIKSEFSGHMEDALLYIANTALPGPPGIARDAALLEESMAGIGTKDERLLYRVMRAHWNRPRFEEVKRVYAATQSKKGLKARVEGEISGDFKRFLVAIIGN